MKSNIIILQLSILLTNELVSFSSSSSTRTKNNLRSVIEDNNPPQDEPYETSKRTTSNTSTSSTNTKKPNILFLQLDQWRYDWDGMSSSPTGDIPLNLPFIKHAASIGTRFTQAYVPSPICAPSRACLASGKEYDFTGVPKNHADDYPTDQTTIYKLLRDEGNYHTMVCGKDDLYKGDVNFPYYPGTQYDELMDLGFSDALRSAGKTHTIKEHEPYEMYRILLEETIVSLENGTQISAFDAYKSCNELDPHRTNNNMDDSDEPHSLCDISSFPDELYPDNYVRDNALKLLERKPTGDDAKPWFLQVNFPGPHPPNLVTSKMAKSVIDRTWPRPYDVDDNFMDANLCPQIIEGDEDFRLVEPQNGGSARCNYAAEIENIDMLMNDIVSAIDNAGELDETIVCIFGDHGEMLGDHQQFAKSKPWQSSVSVPVICFGPNIGAGKIYDKPITTLDLMGTALEYANIIPEKQDLLDTLEITTKSLKYILEDNIMSEEEQEIVGETVDRRSYISSGYDNWRLVVKDISMNEETSSSNSYKLICCKGPCLGSPSTAMADEISDDEWHMLLYNVDKDKFDMKPLNNDFPNIVDELRQLLPNGWCPLDGTPPTYNNDEENV